MADDLSSYGNAIGSIESSNNYGATGPATRNGDQAYGRYQVMGNNIPDWTEKHFGQRLSPQEFLNNPQAQDAVFNGEFGSYVKKYGNPQDAASVWFSGRPLAKAGNADDQYITTPQYVQRFNAALAHQPTTVQAGAPSPTQAIPPQAPPIMPDIPNLGTNVPNFAQIPQAPLPPIYFAPRKQIDLSALRALLSRNS